ncbi:hypothetical protein BDL97_09G027300 [Sphagnum fallax]|nr:hypothetical protein BDL97_09G027300 [Sphagnum fallax]
MMMMMEPIIFCRWKESSRERSTCFQQQSVDKREFHVQIHPVGVRDGLSVVTDLAGHNMTVVVMAVDGCDHHVNTTYFQLLPDSRLFSSSWLQMCMFFFAERPAVKTQLMTI